MTDNIPQSIVNRLEREWRFVDRERPPQPTLKENDEREPLRRLKVGRVD